MKPFGPPSASYRSPQFGAIRGSLLTDERIFRYALKGFYGATRQRAAALELRLRQMTKKAEKSRAAERKAQSKSDDETLSFLGIRD